MTQLFAIALVIFFASYIQSVTGFGFGIFAMIFLPSLLIYTEANVLSSMLSMITSLTVVFALFFKIDYKNLVFPMVGCLGATYLSVNFVKSQANELLMLLLGIVLFALSIYFFFFSGKIRIKISWYTGLIAGVLSGILGGMFSIGGPPVVIYYMQSEDDSEHYLATISAYFVLSGTVSVITKANAGFITSNVWLGFVIGLIALALGTFLGKCTRSKIKGNALRRAVYAFMAVSGLVNIVTSIV